MTTLAYDAMTGECIRVDPNALALAAKDALAPDPARALECTRQETKRNRNARKRLNRRLRREEQRKRDEALVTKASEPPSRPPSSLPPPLSSQSSPCGESGGAAAANTMGATAIDHEGSHQGSHQGSQFVVVLRSVLLSLLHELQRSNTDGVRDTTPPRNLTRCTEEWVAALILHRRLAELGGVERNVTRLLSRELRFTMDRMIPTTSASTVSVVATWREQALQILGGDDCSEDGCGEHGDACAAPLNDSPV